jgi:hypothetical protein
LKLRSLRRRFELGCRYSGQVLSCTAGAHLVNAAASAGYDLFYWREGTREVDFVVRSGRKLTAIEVKSGRTREARSGLSAFAAAFGPSRQLLVGGDGIALEDSLRQPVSHWIAR